MRRTVELGAANEVSSDYQLEYITEPRLCFGHGQETEHPKDGLFLFGPVEDPANPAEMRVGVIGTRKGLAHYTSWVTTIQQYIEPKVAGRSHHAGWPGFKPCSAQSGQRHHL